MSEACLSERRRRRRSCCGRRNGQRGRKAGEGAFTLGATAHELDAILGELSGGLQNLLNLVGHCEFVAKDWVGGEDGRVVVVTFRDGCLSVWGNSGTSLETCSQDWPRGTVGNSSGAKKCGTLGAWMRLDSWRRCGLSEIPGPWSPTGGTGIRAQQSSCLPEANARRQVHFHCQVVTSHHFFLFLFLHSDTNPRLWTPHSIIAAHHSLTIDN